MCQPTESVTKCIQTVSFFLFLGCIPQSWGVRCMLSVGVDACFRRSTKMLAGRFSAFWFQCCTMSHHFRVDWRCNYKRFPKHSMCHVYVLLSMWKRLLSKQQTWTHRCKIMHMSRYSHTESCSERGGRPPSGNGILCVRIDSYALFCIYGSLIFALIEASFTC